MLNRYLSKNHARISKLRKSDAKKKWDEKFTNYNDITYPIDLVIALLNDQRRYEWLKAALIKHIHNNTDTKLRTFKAVKNGLKFAPVMKVHMSTDTSVEFKVYPIRGFSKTETALLINDSLSHYNNIKVSYHGETRYYDDEHDYIPEFYVNVEFDEIAGASTVKLGEIVDRMVAKQTKKIESEINQRQNQIDLLYAEINLLEANLSVYRKSVWDNFLDIIR